MHKTHHRPPSRSAATSPRAASQKRPNRRRRNWDRAIRRVCAVVFILELALLVFANPHLQVSKVRIDGLQTLSTAQVFAEAQVPARTNIFWMALHEPFNARLTRDPVIDHVTRTIALPRTLVLHVTERQPYAVLAAADPAGGTEYWLLDRKRVPYRMFLAPPPGVPIVQWQGAAPPLALGRPAADPSLADAYALMALVQNDPRLAVKKITVDQNANLCLNSVDNLQIKLGQPDALPEKIAMAQATLNAQGGLLARQMASLDLSSPEQPVCTPRLEASASVTNASAESNNQGHYGQ